MAPTPDERPKLSPEARRLRAQIAANSRWARQDPSANAARGQAGLLARFEREVDPDNTLPPAERARRVEAARREHMARMSFASLKARQSKGITSARRATPPTG